MTAYISVQTVASEAGVSARTVRNWITRGALPATRAEGGRAWIVTRAQWEQTKAARAAEGWTDGRNR